MKKSIFFMLLGICCSFSPAFAQNLIALQHNGSATFFTTIPDAVTAAASGDTIYLPGGSFPGFNIDKKLAIIGVGHNPDSTAATGMTLISGDLNMVTAECDGSSITGLRANAIQNIGGDNDYIQILRCFFPYGIFPGNYNGYNSSTASENWTISECFIGSIQTVLSNSFVSNNLIREVIESAQNCQINNNIFFSGSNAQCLITCNSCTVNNNIFYRINIQSNISNSLFNNNIVTFDSGITNGLFPDGNIGTGNIKTPGLINYEIDGLFTNFSYYPFYFLGANPYSFDFHLVNPDYNTGGTDGTPIGIYGGLFPWKDGSLPFNPHILSKSIGNITDQNGNLLINIQVEAQDH